MEQMPEGGFEPVTTTGAVASIHWTRSNGDPVDCK